jgi:hypothetical protein
MQVVPLPRGVAATHQAAAELQANIAEAIEVEVGITTWRGRGFVRVSAHAYNAPSHFDGSVITLRSSSEPEWRSAGRARESGGTAPSARMAECGGRHRRDEG